MTVTLISGGMGFVGRFIVECLLARGDDVLVMGRERPPANLFSQPVDWVFGTLDPDRDWTPSFADVDHFVHAAFAHVPGKYRGGEGDDPVSFSRQNVDGSLALFRAAKQAGVSRSAFLSSRAVYDGTAPGTVLIEEMAVSPTSLYGQIKHAVELGLAAMADAAFLPISLRATGIYGPPGLGARHKWTDLFEAFARGEMIASRVGSEVHGDDLAAAIWLLLATDADEVHRFGAAPRFNVSDIVLDRRDLLAAYAKRVGIDRALPARADRAALNVMDCSRLRALGWSPLGQLVLPS
ncbi:MAG: NAD(P)-dependent oxidoreductase [Pseudomonadota bacterium]